MFFNSTLVATLSDSDDERYKAELARRCAEAETLLHQQEEEAWRKEKEKESW